MTNYQEARDRMYRKIIGISSENAGIIRNLPDYINNLGKLENIISEIESAARDQKIDTKGVTKYKLQLRNLLILLAADNARKLTSFAKLTNNQILLGQVNYTESDFKRYSDDAIKDHARIIYNCAEPIIDQLTSYDISTDTQTAFLIAINNYTEALGSPDLAGTIRKQATEKLVRLFSEGNQVVDKMAAAVEVVRIKEPVFYLGFKTAQKLNVKGITTLSVKGHTKDANGQTLSGVTITVTLNGTIVLVKKTAEKGGFYIRSLAAGTYAFTFKKTGLAEQTTNVVVNSGEMTRLKVIMVTME